MGMKNKLKLCVQDVLKGVKFKILHKNDCIAACLGWHCLRDVNKNIDFPISIDFCYETECTRVSAAAV